MSAPETTVELLRRVAAEHPDRAAFVEVERRLTFAQWDRAADGVAAYFAAAGVGPGRRRRTARAVVDRLRRLLPGRDAAARHHDRDQHAARAARDREHPRPHAAARGRARRRSRRGAEPRTRTTRPRSSHASEPDDPRRDRVDERHHRDAEGRGVRPPQPAGRGDRCGRDGRAVRRAARAAAVRARRVHVAAVGGDRERHHDGDHADPVDRGRRVCS